MGLSAILPSLRQILKYINCREYSRAEIKWNRLCHFRECRSCQHQRGGTCTPASGYPRCPFSWISMPFPIAYVRTCHIISYASRCLPQLEGRPFHPWCPGPPIAWTTPRSSYRENIRIKRSRRQGGFSIWNMRTLLNPHFYFQKA